MRSYGTDSLSAATRVKVLSPEIIHIAYDQRFHVPEVEIRSCDIGECESGVPGSESVAGKQIVYVGTWENRIVSKRSLQSVEETMRGYGDLVVGLTNSRGVGRLMPAEFQEEALEVVGSPMKRGKRCNAIH
jgi:hypothetical protein